MSGPSPGSRCACAQPRRPKGGAVTDTVSATTADTSAAATAPPVLRHLAGHRIDRSGPEQVDTTPAYPELGTRVRGAADTFPGWARIPFPVRGELLTRVAEFLAAHAEPWGTELATEEGKTLEEGAADV